ncbi:hypothetical protein [Coleofasciculus sp.]|uniref:hypothetical protein n=1 Tax=Coleofasciculus sp. TaxID=3100458 RepID=UPI003B4DEA5D
MSSLNNQQLLEVNASTLHYKGNLAAIASFSGVTMTSIPWGILAKMGAGGDGGAM